MGVGLIAMRVRVTGFLPSLPRGKRAWWLVAAGLVASIVSVGMSRLLPFAHEKTVAEFTRWERGARSGFSSSVKLGPSSDIRESDALVMRIRGGRVDYLRGVVLGNYSRGEWIPWPTNAEERIVPSAPIGRLDGAIEIQLEIAQARYFLPLHARNVAADDGRIRADSAGVALATGVSAERVRFRPGPRDALNVDALRPIDLELPASLRPQLEGIAKEWAKEHTVPQQRARAIESRLRTGYRYALSHRRGSIQDPIIDFLTVNRVGHCEYFASALALLLRADGIPARVVGGYRVSEENATGAYQIVRELDAHAWVEAWLGDNGWVTLDATPTGATAGRERKMSALEGLFDLLRSGWLAERLRVEPHWWMAAGAIAGSLVALALLLRGIKRRRGGRKATGPSSGPARQLEALLAALEKVGVHRSESETIDSLAARLEQAGGTIATAAPVLRRYAAWRYGGIGDAAAIERGLQEWPASVSRNQRLG
jgi:transglutaminase-like putative cysteine protease